MRRLFKILKGLGLVVFAAASLLLGLLAWGLLSDAGARQLLRVAGTLAGKAGIEFQVGQVQGSVLDTLALQDLRISTGPDLNLQARRLELAWRPWHLLQQRLQIDRVQLDGLRVQTRSDPAAATAPFDAAVISDWFAAVPLVVELAQWRSRDLQLDIDGSLVDIPVLDLAAGLDSTGLQLSALRVEAMSATVDAALALQSDLALQGQLDWRWEAGTDSYSGRARLGGTLLQLSLGHELQTPLPVLSEGELQTGLSPAAPLQLDLEHRLDVLALDDWGVPGLEASGLLLQTRGTPADLALELALQASYQDYAPLQVQAQARYAPEALELALLRADSAELALQTQGRWVFDSSTLNLDWILERLDLERDGLQLQQVAGTGSVALVLDAGGVDGTLQLGPLQGQLNAQPLLLEAELALVDSTPASLVLDVRNAANRLQASGSLQPALSLSWTLEAPALQQLYAPLGGTLQGAGELGGSFAAPRLNGRLQGAELSLQLDGQRIGLASLELAAVTTGESSDVELQLQGLRRYGPDVEQELLQAAALTLEGGPDAHTVQLRATGMDAALDIGLQGALQGSDWQARVTRASVGTPIGDWLLQQGFGLAWQAGQLQVGEHCWAGAPMLLCLSVEAAASGQAAQLELSGLPLHWLNRRTAGSDKPAALQDLQTAWGFDLPAGLALSGQAALTAAVSGWSGGLPPVLRAELRSEEVMLTLSREIEPGDGADPVVETQRFGISGAPLLLTREAGTWRAVADLTVTEQAAAEAEPAETATGGVPVAVLQGSLGADLTLDDARALGGVVQLSFGDLAFVESLVPGLDDPVGRLRGSIQLAGSLEQPEVVADLQLSEAGFSLPAMGIVLQDLGAELSSSRDLLQLQASARSGEGQLRLQADMQRPLEASRVLNAQLAGSDFRLLAREDLQATVSPELQLRYAEDALALEGTVRVLQALLDLESLIADVGDGGVAVSRDVVVVQADPQAQVAEQQRALPFAAGLGLLLGDEVRVRGFGLDAALTGELRVQQEPGRPLLAFGELGMPQATYRIYNQELAARDGRLLFYGNPLNPTLDVRAYRETPSAEVGMLLSGTLGRIQSRLYSTPTLPENEILAILITGKSFNDMNDQDGNALLNAVANFGIERGEGLTSMIGDKLGLDTVAINGGASYQDSSLGLGKYITPDLLLRYEIGLFDRQAVLSIDYALTERLRLEVRSGLSQSVDVSYTIEKD